MELMLTFLLTAITALAAENAIFARALGINKQLLYLKSPRMGILYGGLLTCVLTTASALVSVANIFLEDHPLILFIRAPIYFICVALVFVGVYFATRRYRPMLHIRIRAALPISTFNSALFGPLYITAFQDFRAYQIIAYALGAGIGYTLALLVIYYARKRLALSPIPRSFRGLPSLLIYIGLLSLAIYGLVGHMLPA